MTSTMAKPSVLYLDIEGGFGGSSLSLFYFLSELDRTRFDPVVWYRSAGPVRERLEILGIPHDHRPDMVHITPIERNNLKNILVHLPRMSGMRTIVKSIQALNPAILHLNHVGLAPLAFLLRLSGWKGRILVHVRSQFPKNLMSGLYCRALERSVDHVIFITENELQLAQRNGFDASADRYSIVYNPAPPDMFDWAPAQARVDGPLRLVFLGTLSHLKGPDRLLDLAQELNALQAPVQIDAYGGAPRQIGKKNALETLRQSAAQRNLQHMLTYHGHTDTPMAALKNAGMLVRTSRGRDPWGRDIIEAMAAGIPVLAEGTYDGFVEDGVTGILMQDWNAGLAAARVAELAADKDLLDKMRSMSKEKAGRLFKPDIYANRLMETYDAILA